MLNEEAKIGGIDSALWCDGDVRLKCVEHAGQGRRPAVDIAGRHLGLCESVVGIVCGEHARDVVQEEKENVSIRAGQTSLDPAQDVDYDLGDARGEVSVQFRDPGPPGEHIRAQREREGCRTARR